MTQCEATLQMDEQDNVITCNDAANTRVYRKDGRDDDGILCCPVCATTLLDSGYFYVVE